MNIDKAIEVLKYLSNSIKIGGGKSLIYTRDAEAIDTVVAHLTSENKSGLDEKLDEKGKQQSDNQCQCSCKKDEEYYSKYSDGLQKTVIPHIDKIERLIKKQHRSPQEITLHIAEASSIVGKAYYHGFGNGFDEGIKFYKKRKDANKDRK